MTRRVLIRRPEALPPSDDFAAIDSEIAAMPEPRTRPEPAASAAKDEKRDRVTVVVNAANEGFVIGFLAANQTDFGRLGREIVPEHFATRENRQAWEALQALHRLRLDFAPATIAVHADAATAEHVSAMIRATQGAPHNAEWHVRKLLIDASRMRAAKSAVPSLLELLRDPASDPEKLRTAANAVAATFVHYERKSHLLDTETIVAEQMKQIRTRDPKKARGYGIPGFDFFERTDIDGEPVWRVTPGTEPGQITCLTALSSAGKTTTACNMVLGMSRRVLYGAWEVNPGASLEILATIDLRWARSRVAMGGLGLQDLKTIEERMMRIGQRVKFLRNPFQRGGGEKRRTNDYNLDLLHSYVLESGCEVFIADLWKRCLVDTSPEAEEEALYKQQALTADGQYHAILVQQQRLKDIEQRPDKRPTREGIKGSGAWTEVPDTIIGVHRPAMWKDIADDKLELIILKQRYGKAPIVVECDWDAERGLISGGRSVAYKRPGEGGNELDEMAKAVPFGGSKRRSK